MGPMTVFPGQCIASLCLGEEQTREGGKPVSVTNTQVLTSGTLVAFSGSEMNCKLKLDE